MKLSGKSNTKADPESEHEAEAIEELARSAAAGSSDALGLLYERYFDATYRYVYVRVRDKAIAEDVTAVAWLSVCRSIRTYKTVGAGFPAWLFRIVGNAVKDRWRASTRNRELPTAEMFVLEGEFRGATGYNSPEDAALARELGEQVAAGLKKLSTNQAAVVTLRLFHGLTIVETASVLGVTPGAVKTLQHRAMKRLARLLSELHVSTQPRETLKGETPCPDARSSRTTTSQPFSTEPPAPHGSDLSTESPPKR